MRININTPEGELQMRELIAAGKMVEIEGGWATVTDAPPSPVPRSVNPWQIRRALNARGLRAGVEAAVAAGTQDMKDGWEFASEIRRDHPLVIEVGTILGKSSKELDDLFRTAATL